MTSPAMTETETETTTLDRQLTVLLQDPLLSDLPQQVTPLEVEQLLAYEQGHAIRLVLDRGALQKSLEITASQTITVAVLKRLVQLAVDRHIRDTTTLMHGRSRSANWSYTWQRYCLMVNSQRLLDTKQRIHELGLHNGDRLRFVRYTPPKPERSLTTTGATSRQLSRGRGRGRGGRGGRGRGHRGYPVEGSIQHRSHGSSPW
ncbi:hypothetical protein BDF19DRAFT_35378 [Syncephalis fuscata]|nr:hypothetical protein BDF19DRAFT_35378 [Syncephalis fuscata]